MIIDDLLPTLFEEAMAKHLLTQDVVDVFYSIHYNVSCDLRPWSIKIITVIKEKETNILETIINSELDLSDELMPYKILFDFHTTDFRYFKDYDTLLKQYTNEWNSLVSLRTKIKSKLETNSKKD